MMRGQYYVALAVLAVAGLAGGALASWLAPGRAAWAQEQLGDVVTAREFRLIDDEGEIRAWFDLEEDGSPALFLFDAAGKVRAGLGLLEGGHPSLALFDAAGNARIALVLGQDGRPALALCDAAGNDRAVVGCTETVIKASGVTTKHAESTITLFNDTQDVVWQAQGQRERGVGDTGRSDE